MFLVFVTCLIYFRRVKSLDEPSGYGYELTIRVKQDRADTRVPRWPIKLLQSLAKYTFSNGVLFEIGDHIPNVLAEYDTKVKHLLVAEDNQLRTARTRYGKVKFLQVNLSNFKKK